MARAPPGGCAFNANANITRPSLIALTNVNTVLVTNVTLQNYALSGLIFGVSSGNAGTNVTIQDLTCTDPNSAPNTDGMDLAGSNFNVEGISVTTGGNDIEINPQLVAANNYTFNDCNFGFGNGFVVGGQTNAGLNGLSVSNCVFSGTTFGFRFIAGRGNGGLVQNVSVSDITMTGVTTDIFIDSYFENGNNFANADLPNDPEADSAQTFVAGSTPQWENISFSSIVTSNQPINSRAGFLIGLPESPIQGVSFDHDDFNDVLGFQADHAHGVTVDLQTQINTDFEEGDSVIQFPSFYEDNGFADGNNEFQPLATGGFDAEFDSTITIDPMTVTDIGSPAHAGTAVYDTHYQNTLVTGTGNALGGTSDKFTFEGTPIYGDTVLTANYLLLTTTGSTPSNAEGGLMIRESLNPNAAFVFIGLQNDGSGTKLIVEERDNDGGAVVNDGAVLDIPPMANQGMPQIRIERTGDIRDGRL